MSVIVVAYMRCMSAMQGTVHAMVVDHARTVRREPGCIRFMPYVEHGDEDVVVVLEEYRSESDFQSHLAANHSRAFNRAIASLVVGGKSTLTHLRSLEAARP
ncbi:hypothetical protein GCM10025864_25800 [Luteimicrobium album]|uniref:ABM domain-containing protein n=1 Tax=Luteimicrobium album TaxID=1054550 RepID=A0ABQ6I250_9MICO|nr:antibiotic biosynthesis monooxygenase [Luteimicrobium album]GMA24821.1 hypothetical protein GCM10025864_25800 [Luteimicrobium album]